MNDQEKASSTGKQKNTAGISSNVTRILTTTRHGGVVYPTAGGAIAADYLRVKAAATLQFSDAVANTRGRRRFGPSSKSTSLDEVTEKASGDQMVASASHTEANKYRRGGAYSSDAADYIYNTADINLIQPEHKPLHTKITAKYTSSITIPHDSMEDTETAEEYVAKAMGMYGSRLREPIRVSYVPETTQAEQVQTQPQPQNQQYQQHNQHHQQQMMDQDQRLLNSNQQQEQSKEQEIQNQKQTNYDYYTRTFPQKEVQHQLPSYAAEEDQSQQQAYHQYTSPTATENDAKEQLEEQMQTQIQDEINQAQQLVKDKERETSQAQQNEADDSPAPVYEKDPVTRSYNIYEEHTEGYDPSQQSAVERNYRTKYIYKPVPQYQETGKDNEERIRVSASTEIPKAEIMKQIEKSVIKYMRELEAEGKIIAAPQNQEPKTYFKVITVPGTDEKRIASSTVKPNKYTSSPSGSYTETYIQSPQNYRKNSVPKSNSQTENESAYQTSAHEVAELTPNVEFIYKIKTKAPLHTATVKTVSKPYNLPIKSYEQFDHSTALKNLEEFDLSHVVTTPDPEKYQTGSSNKPNKLYFNSEIYHDINSLTYKQKQRAEAELRKLKAAAENHPDYRDYTASSSQSGYYAEPPSSSDRENERETSEDGYPLVNPYKHILKKEVTPSKYDDSISGYEQQQPRSHKYKPFEFDSYNPKFNNNPEGYGYQQTYKTQLSNRHAPGKRGKRGGLAHPSVNKKSSHRASQKDYEANIALRPPSKN